MIFTLVLIAVIVVSVAVLTWLGVRKLPQLRVVDPASSREAKAREMKQSILQKRLERLGSERVQSLKRDVLLPLGSRVQELVRRFAGKLTALERKYADRQKGAKQLHNPEVLRVLVQEAEAFINEERYDAAEKKLIEVVSHDPKNVPAYERLGRLYLLTKDLAGAKETFQFLSRLSPRDASVLASLGEVAEAQNDPAAAMVYYKQALDISPHNPKYLDFYVESAIANEDVTEATMTLDHLREVNPENQKIAEFEERIALVRERKKAG